jgi:hypothetical protein
MKRKNDLDGAARTRSRSGRPSPALIRRALHAAIEELARRPRWSRRMRLQIEGSTFYFSRSSFGVLLWRHPNDRVPLAGMYGDYY